MGRASLFDDLPPLLWFGRDAAGLRRRLSSIRPSELLSSSWPASSAADPVESHRRPAIVLLPFVLVFPRSERRIVGRVAWDGKLVPGADGKIVVEIKGLDIYDPTTGEIRSNSTDDIACWFIDTDYDGESFFVRHAYFTGADQPYERLRKALRAEINEEAWSSLYRTVSRPFDPPGENRRVAIKVINHYGDEVLKVYEVANPTG